MKIKLFAVVILLGISSGINAQNEKKEESFNVDETVEKLYKTFLPVLDRIEITGSSEASQELQKRWGWVVNHLKNNQGQMAEEVKKLLISPTGKTIDLEMIKEFINITGKDSTMKITLNPDFILNELKAMSNKLVQESNKMAEHK